MRDSYGVITTFDGLPMSINPRGETTGTDSAHHGFVRDSDGTITKFDAGRIGTFPQSMGSLEPTCFLPFRALPRQAPARRQRHFRQQNRRAQASSSAPKPRTVRQSSGCSFALRRCWLDWKQALLVVTVRWHRAAFRSCWWLISKVRKSIGRRPISKEVRGLIFQIVGENPSCALRGELLARFAHGFSCP